MIYLSNYDDLLCGRMTRRYSVNVDIISFIEEFIHYVLDCLALNHIFVSHFQSVFSLKWLVLFLKPTADFSHGLRLDIIFSRKFH